MGPEYQIFDRQGAKIFLNEYFSQVEVNYWVQQKKNDEKVHYPEIGLMKKRIHQTRKSVLSPDDPAQTTSAGYSCIDELNHVPDPIVYRGIPNRIKALLHAKANCELSVSCIPFAIQGLHTSSKGIPTQPAV